MKKLLRLTSMMVTALLLTCFARNASASHQQAADLTYVCVSPNTYVVTLKFYRDCSGIDEANTYPLRLTAPGCNTSRPVINLPKVGNTAGVVGTPYCSPALNNCSGSTANYQEFTYQTVVTFTAAEMACPNWTLSVTFNDGNRPTTANVSGAPAMYIEAFLKLDPTWPNPIAAGINNNSPEFNSLTNPVPFVCVGEDYNLSLSAGEADGDSLSYRLVAPMSAANTNVTYKPIQGITGGLLQNPNPPAPYCNNCTPPNPQIAQIPGVTGNYTPTYPMPSYVIDWNKINPATGVPYQFVTGQSLFNLNASTGQLSFRPIRYVAGNQAENKYNVAVEITEWRRHPVTGVMTKVGSIRRDMLFIVIDCGGNKKPVTTVPPFDTLSYATHNDTIFDVQTCNTTRIRLRYIDQNPNDKLTVSFLGVNKGATVGNVENYTINNFPNNSGNMKVYNNTKNDTVTAVLYITPDSTHFGQEFRFTARIEDNSCPLKAIFTETYRIRVVKKPLARVEGGKTRQICLGDTSTIRLFVSRPDSINQAPADYTYHWKLAPGIDPADVNKQVIKVTPKVTTRYFAKIKSRLTGCADTTSVVVRVNEVPIIQKIDVKYATGIDYINFGRTAPINVTLGNSDTTGFRFRWTPGKDLSDSTVLNPVVSSLKTQTYKLKITTPNGCADSLEVTVKVGPFFLPNIITPNNDGKNDKFEYKGIEPNTSLKIYNRWGVEVKSYKSYDNSFGGEGVSDGVYYYILKEPKNGKTYKGYFEIVR